MRMEPPVSVPSAPKQKPAATAAAEPPDEPPVIRSRSHGLRTAPKRLIVDVAPIPNSCRLSLPRKTAPASRSRRTTSASSVGTRCSKTALAAVVRRPAVSMLSFSAIGMPCSGPRHRPAASSSSARRASASALSSVTVMNALSCASKRSIRARQARVSSTGETARDFSASAAELRSRSASSSSAPAACVRAVAHPSMPASAAPEPAASPATKSLRDGCLSLCWRWDWFIAERDRNPPASARLPRPSANCANADPGAQTNRLLGSRCRRSFARRLPPLLEAPWNPKCSSPAA